MRKAFDFCLGIFLFLVATAYVGGNPFGIIQGHVFKIGIIALFILSLYMKPLRWITNVWVNAMIALAVITTLALNSQGKMMAIEGMVNVMLGVILLYTIIQHLDNKKVILNAICAVIAVNTFMVFCQVMHMDPICLNDSGLPNSHMVGLFGFKYVFGAYMALVAPLLLFSNRKVFGCLAVILTVCSLSWAAVACLFGSLICALWFINKKAFVIFTTICISIAIATCIITTNKYKDSGNKYHPLTFKGKALLRLKLESKFLPILMARPLQGNGLGSFKYIGPQIDTYPFGSMLDAWNDYLERGIECGVGMIALMLALFWGVWKRFLQSSKKRLMGIMAALGTVPVGIMFHDYFNHFSLTATMITILALYEITIGEDYDNKVCG